MVEGTPLLREHTAYTRIEGSNPSNSARYLKKPLIFKGFFFVPCVLYGFLYGKNLGKTACSDHTFR